MDLHLKPEAVRQQLIALGIPPEQHSPEALRKLVPSELRGSISQAEPELLRELLLHWGRTGLLRLPTAPAALAIQRIAYGTHSCHVYRETDDLIEIAVPWIQAGLADGHFGLWIVPDSVSVEAALESLAAAIPDFEARFAARQLEVVSSAEWYFDGGTARSDAEMGAAWAGKIAQAKQNGFAGVRAVGDMSWISGRADIERFLAYEERCNELASQLPLAGLCTYRLDSVPREVLGRLGDSHQRTLLKVDGIWHRLDGGGSSTTTALESMRDGNAVNGGLQFASPTLAGRQFPANRHACGFFRNSEEQYRTLMPFIQEGFSRGEKAVHVIKRDDQASHVQFLKAAGVDVERTLSSGQLELLDWEQSYLRNGRFDLTAMPALIEELISRSRAEGYPLLRYVGNMEWSLENLPGVDEVLEYESRLHPLLLKFPDPVICCYQIGRYSSDFVLEMLSVHQIAVVCGILNENPFFIPPEKYLAWRKSAPPRPVERSSARGA